MRAKVALFARVKDSAKPSGYRFDTIIVRRGRPVPVLGATAYYLRYQCNGKRVVRALGSDLEVAFVSFENHQRNLPSLMRGESITSDLLADFQQNAAGVTLREAAETYLQQLQTKAASTVSSYRFAVNEFIRNVGEGMRISSVDRNVLLRYREWLYKQGLNENTLHSRLLKVVIFLKSAGVEKLLRKGDWPTINERVPEAYTPDEISRMFAVSDPEERLLIEFFLTSGARNGEVRHVVKGDIKISGECATLNIREKPELGWRTKGKRDRPVRLPLEFAKRLLAAREHASDDDLLFPNGQGGVNRHFDTILNRVAERAKISGRTDWHKFRSTFATRLSGVGVPVQDIQKYLGHRDIQTTLRYLAATSHESEAAGRMIEQAFGV